MEVAFLGSAIRIFSLQDTPLLIKIIFGFNESFHSDSLSKSCYDSFEVGNSEARDQISWPRTITGRIRAGEQVHQEALYQSVSPAARHIPSSNCDIPAHRLQDSRTCSLSWMLWIFVPKAREAEWTSSKKGAGGTGGPLWLTGAQCESCMFGSV